VLHPHLIPSAELQSLPRNGFTDAHVLVIGDLMLDQYVDGEVHRISPEAPVPVLSVQKRRCAPGGAANVALNVIGLHARVSVAGLIGCDASGVVLRDLLTRSGVDLGCLLTSNTRPTTSKTRIISGNHQIVRLDEEVSDTLDDELHNELLQKIGRYLDTGNVCAVILSDYSKGVLSGSCPQRIIQACRTRGIPVLVDPKRLDYAAYRGCTLVTPNRKEFNSAITYAGFSEYEFEIAGTLFREHLQCAALLVTQGADGMTLFASGQAWHLPAIAEEVFDVSGAGDTVIATLGVAVGSGITYRAAVELANAAASIVVRRAGTTPVVWPDLQELLGVGAVEHPARSDKESVAGVPTNY
jgi:D-beta-D-heptose 7-phosphate kinase/D-beta-D-heptose 1-phosphate adenosyltransferase